MRFEYILLIMLTVFPLIYKLGYWQAIFSQQNYSIRNFTGYLLSQQGRESLFHFWTLLEFPVFLVCFVPFFDPNFEYLFYPMFFYFLVFYNVFVLWKLFRKKMHVPKLDVLTIVVVFFVILEYIGPIIYPISIYITIMSTLLFVPVYFMASSLALYIFTPKKTYE